MSFRTQRVTLSPSYIGILLSILFATSIIAFATFKPILVLPRMALAPGFALIDQNDQILSNEALRGKIVLYNFTYSRCQPPCPNTSPFIYKLQERLAQAEIEGPDIEFVTISLDVWDTPERLLQFANLLGADFDQWHFVTGEPKVIKQIVGGGFSTYYSEEERTEDQDIDAIPILYDPTFVLVDGWGIQRAKYQTAQPSIDILWRDIHLLLDEAQNSKGVMRYGYEAAHLFLCYP